MKYTLILAFGLMSCKRPAATTDLQTLDHLAGGNQKYQCQGNYPLVVKDLSALGAEPYASIAKKALTSLSENLQESIFNKLSTRIEYTKENLVSKCPGAATYTSEALQSCYAGEKPVIYVSVSEDLVASTHNIEQAMIRSALAVFTDTLLSVDDKQTPSFTDVKIELTSAFLSDLQTAGKLTAVAGPLVPELKDQDRTKRDTALRATKDQETTQMFMTTVVVDSLHSYMCHTSSRTVFQSSFPATWEVFSRTFALDLQNPQSQPGSFGLWGRWGYGNGPLRQASANWVDHRRSGGGLFNARRYYQGGGGFVIRRGLFGQYR